MKMTIRRPGTFNKVPFETDKVVGGKELFALAMAEDKDRDVSWCMYVSKRDGIALQAVARAFIYNNVGLEPGRLRRLAKYTGLDLDEAINTIQRSKNIGVINDH